MKQFSEKQYNILLITIAVIVVVVGNIVTNWIFISIGTSDYVVYLGCFLSAFIAGIVGSLLYKGKLFTKWIILSAILIFVILILIMIIIVFSVEDQPISSLKLFFNIFGFIFAIDALIYCSTFFVTYYLKHKIIEKTK